MVLAAAPRGLCLFSQLFLSFVGCHFFPELWTLKQYLPVSKLLLRSTVRFGHADMYVGGRMDLNKRTGCWWMRWGGD